MEAPSLMLVPGPTPVPDDVREACARPMIPHRGPEFAALHAEVVSRLRILFRTEGEVVILPCSGTGALEAAVVNVLSPRDRVLSCVMGEFGQRLAGIAASYGVTVDRLDVPWGEAADANVLATALVRGRKRYRAVLLTHSETSTGALLPLKEIAAAVRRISPETLILVDMVSSFAAVEVRLDDWGVDVAVSASQKALMTPPGLGLVALGRRGLAAARTARLPRFTWDLRPYLDEPGRPPYTPAVGLWFALRAALERIEREGECAVYRRHRLMSRMARAGVRAIGLQPLTVDTVASPTVTAVALPNAVSAEKMLALLARRGVILAGGQGPLRGRVVRMGHMGAVTPNDVERALGGVQAAARELGLPPGEDAVEAARVVRSAEEAADRARGAAVHNSGEVTR